MTEAEGTMGNIWRRKYNKESHDCLIAVWGGTGATVAGLSVCCLVSVFGQESDAA